MGRRRACPHAPEPLISQVPAATARRRRGPLHWARRPAFGPSAWPGRDIPALRSGIGLSNVNERLRTVYGASCTLTLTSQPGRGTSVSMDIPDLIVPERIPA